MLKGRKTISTVLSLTMACVVSTSQPTHAEGQTFKSGVEMVALTVTVTNAADHCVTGLTERDFVVYEEGIPQTVSLFGADEVLTDVALARFPMHVRRQGKCSIRQDRVDTQIGVAAECRRAVDQLTCRGGQRLQYGHRS